MTFLVAASGPSRNPGVCSVVVTANNETETAHQQTQRAKEQSSSVAALSSTTVCTSVAGQQLLYEQVGFYKSAAIWQLHTAL